MRGPWQKGSGVLSENYISCPPLSTGLLVSLGSRLGWVTRNSLLVSSQLMHPRVTAIWHLPMQNCLVRIFSDHCSPWLHSAAISPGYSVSSNLLQCTECSVPYIIPQRSKAIRQRNNTLAVFLNFSLVITPWAIKKLKVPVTNRNFINFWKRNFWSFACNIFLFKTNIHISRNCWLPCL